MVALWHNINLPSVYDVAPEQHHRFIVLFARFVARTLNHHKEINPNSPKISTITFVVIACSNITTLVVVVVSATPI